MPYLEEGEGFAHAPCYLLVSPAQKLWLVQGPHVSTEAPIYSGLAAPVSPFMLPEEGVGSPPRGLAKSSPHPKPSPFKDSYVLYLLNTNGFTRHRSPASRVGSGRGRDGLHLEAITSSLSVLVN